MEKYSPFKSAYFRAVEIERQLPDSTPRILSAERLERIYASYDGRHGYSIIKAFFTAFVASASTVDMGTGVLAGISTATFTAFSKSLWHVWRDVYSRFRVSRIVPPGLALVIVLGTFGGSAYATMLFMQDDLLPIPPGVDCKLHPRDIECLKK